MRYALPLILVLSLRAAAAPTGEQIYKSKCAACHGAAGEGTAKHKQRLEGERSPAQLAEVIAKTMPEDDPGSLSDDDARAVAAYVHDAFYSRVARERNRPARIELARLTVRQYRNAVADLVGSFRGPMKWDGPHGLHGEYYPGRHFNQRVLERTDPQVNFDFGTDTPVPEKIEPQEFSLRWSGSLLAPETGEYEFIVRTEHAARLWVNDAQHPLIDAWVKSGNDTEYRGTLSLIAGRVYPLKLEFSKGKQGVDDSKKQKTKPPPVKASIALLWKRPHGVAEPVPSRNLSPAGAPEGYVCATAFPPDDRSYGWERGTTVSKEWDQANTDAALDAAGYVAEHADEFAGLGTGGRRRRGGGSGNPADINLDGGGEKPSADRIAKLKAFARTFTERAFRRPLSGEQVALVEKQFDAAKDPDVALKRVVLLALKSPRFLYREVGGGPDAYDVAARLSFGLWDSIPDAELLSAAAGGKLATKEQVAKQAERMLADPRAEAKLREFLLTWVKADRVMDLTKDAKQFPGFEATLINDLRTSLELFLDDVIGSEKSDFRQLFLAEEVFASARMAKFYGADAPADTGFVKVKLDGGKRAGVLTHPYLMAAFAHSSEGSPIHRGVFLARGVLGVALRPPPEAVTPLAPDLHPALTTRERVTLQTKSATCMTCHGVMNPLGFTLEHFDAVGRYRDKDRDKPVDASGSYQTRAGKTITVTGARELATFLAGSEEAQSAFAEQLFHHLVQQPVQAYGPGAMNELHKAFAASGFSVRKLVVEEMTLAALKAR